MISILHLALSFFYMLRLQRWLNGIALALLVCGLLMGFLLSGGYQIAGYVLIVGSLVLVAITPVFAGGIGLRFASTRTLLHLRPQGRIKLLLAATLTITVLAALPLLLGVLEAWSDPPFKKSRPDARLFLDVFEIAWTGVALMWICIFALSRTMLAFALMGVIPMAGVQIARYLIPIIPNNHWVLAAGVLAWAAFALWYLRTPAVARPVMPTGFASSSTGFEGTRIFNRLTDIGTPKGAPTLAQATYQYLFGCASPLFFLIVGTWVGALFLLVALFAGNAGRVSLAAQMLSMLPFYAFFNASLGYTTARRTRYLWLRTAFDRRALFEASERSNHLSAMVAWGMTAGIVLLTALFSEPDRAVEHVCFVLLQALLAIAVGYLGMAIVREWSIADIAVTAGVALVFIAQILVLTPRRDVVPMGRMGWGLVGALVLIVLLRAYAMSRWRDLDWRVAKLSRFALGKG